jgi:hypothetical protein
VRTQHAHAYHRTRLTFFRCVQDLLRNTAETHPDYNNLADALKSTKEIADYINESIRQAEQSAKFRNLATQGEQFRVRPPPPKQPQPRVERRVDA